MASIFQSLPVSDIKTMIPLSYNSYFYRPIYVHDLHSALVKATTNGTGALGFARDASLKIYKIIKSSVCNEDDVSLVLTDDGFIISIELSVLGEIKRPPFLLAVKKLGASAYTKGIGLDLDRLGGYMGNRISIKWVDHDIFGLTGQIHVR